MADQFIYLCFNTYTGSSEGKKCRKSTSPTGHYDEISQTSHVHRYTRIASSSRKVKLIILLIYLFLGSVLALGNLDNNKTELFVPSNNVWLQLPDYPFE